MERVGPVSLRLYDLTGREVMVLLDGHQEAGWHEVRVDGTGLAAGMYFYRLQHGDAVLTKAMMLLR